MLKTIPQLIEEIRPTLRCISAEQARGEVEQSGGIIIDVREPSEVAEQPAIGAINIPRGVLEMKCLEHFPDENTNIYIHCATGARATLAAEQLKRLGYKNVNIIACDLETLTKAW